MPMSRKPSAEKLGHPKTSAENAPVVHEISKPTLDERDYCAFPHEDADPEWHVIAQNWFRSLFLSEQAALYTRSDVQEAVITARLLSDQMYKDSQSAMMIDTITRRSDNLITTIGARLQRRVEAIKKETPNKSRGQIAAEELRRKYG